MNEEMTVLGFPLIPTDNHSSKRAPQEDVKWYKRTRYGVTLLTFCGFTISFLMRSNLSVAIVEMTSSKNVTSGNETQFVKAEFEWTSMEKGYLLSSFSWGFFFSSIGGVIATRVGGTNVFGFGLLVTAIFTVLSPWLIRFNITVFTVCRIFEGVAEGFTSAALGDILVYWAPANERSRLIMLAYTGMEIGPAIAYPFCGFIAKFLGWEAIFFVTGTVCLIWFCLWHVYVTRYPTDNRYTSAAEKAYLANEIKLSKDKKIEYPWKEIFTSIPVWAYLNEKLVQGWSLSFALFCLPLFVKDVQNTSIDRIGIISGIPNACSFLMQILGAYIADYLRSRKKMTPSKVHKIYITSSQLMSIVFLIATAIWVHSTLSVVFLTLFRCSYAIAHISYCILTVDMGQRFSSLLQGMAMTALSVGYIFNPLIIGIIVSNHTVAEWSRYFIFLSLFNVWGGTIFSVFGSGELQEWAIQDDRTEADT